MTFLRFTTATLLATVFLTACGTDNGPPVVSQDPPAQPTTIAQAIVAAEKSGALPILNRDDTLLGVDADHDGIRDDINDFISRLPDSEQQKAAVRQGARAYQAALTVGLTNSADLAQASAAISAAVHCFRARYPDELATERRQTIKKYTFNTKARFLAWGAFDAALNGTAFVVPKVNTCVQ